MKTVLVTGGAGFLGSYLCEKYLAAGWKVICVDCFHTGQKQNVKPFLTNPNFQLIEHDIVEPLNINSKVDLILNFACPASPIHYQHDPIWTAKTSFLGTLNMLGLAKKNNARFIQASTSEIYGDPKEHPQKESYWGNVNTIGIRSCYDEGKRIGETLCFDYNREHQVDIGIVRIFNTYGPRMAINDGRVVTNFIVQALRGEDITIYGEGKQTRSFCFVEDLIAGIMKFAGMKNTTGPVNLGNEGEFTMIELAEEVLKQTGSKSKITYMPLPSDDPKTRCPDLTNTRKVLGWEPKIPLKEGIARSIPYFREQLK